MTSITIERNRVGKFVLSGREAMGFSSATGKIELTENQIEQIVRLYNMHVFRDMIDNNVTSRDVEAPAVSKSPSPPPTPPPAPTPAPTKTPTKTLKGGVMVFEPEQAPKTQGNALYHMYVKLVKSQNPDLTHKQALAKASESYQQWKKTQN